MKKSLVAFILGLIIAGAAYAISVNPASNVTADSANTAFTIPYRDVNGNFSVGTISGGLTALAAQVSVSTSAVGATPFVIDGSYTTAQIQAKTPSAAGQLVFNTTTKLVCISTGATVQGYSLAGSAATCQ